MSQQSKLFKQRYYRNLNNLSPGRSVLLSGYYKSEYVAAVQRLKQGYYRNINILSPCSPVLHLGNVQFEFVAAVEMVQTTI